MVGDWVREPAVVRWALRAAITVLVVGLFTLLIEGANRPADPELGPPTTAPLAPVD